MIPIALALRDDGAEGELRVAGAGQPTTRWLRHNGARSCSPTPRRRSGAGARDGSHRHRRQPHAAATDGVGDASAAARAAAEPSRAGVRGEYTVVAGDYWVRFPNRRASASTSGWPPTTPRPRRRSTPATSSASRPAPAPRPRRRPRPRRDHRRSADTAGRDARPPATTAARPPPPPHRSRRRRRPRRRRPPRPRSTTAPPPTPRDPVPAPRAAWRRSSATCGPTSSRTGPSSSPSARAACGPSLQRLVLLRAVPDLLRRQPNFLRQARGHSPEQLLDARTNSDGRRTRCTSAPAGTPWATTEPV